MSDDLYQKAIVDLARDSSAAGTLPDATASVTRDNPLCGDRVTLQATFDKDGRIAALRHQTRGCLLCEAAAATVGRHAVGMGAEDARRIDGAVRDFLRNGGVSPGDWGEVAAFEPVRSKRSRHDCVILAFDALSELADKAPAR